MDTRERTYEERRAEERLGEAAMQTFSPYLPEAAEKARVGNNVSRMVNHDWLSPSAKRGTLEAVMAAKTAHELGFKNQVKHHLLKAEDRFLFDVSNKAVILAREHGCDNCLRDRNRAEPARRRERPARPGCGLLPSRRRVGECKASEREPGRGLPLARLDASRQSRIQAHEGVYMKIFRNPVFNRFGGIRRVPSLQMPRPLFRGRLPCPPVFCPEAEREIAFTYCLKCPKFRVWNAQDGDYKRCWHEFKDLESRGHYDGTWEDHPENFDPETFARIQEEKRSNEQFALDLERERAEMERLAKALEDEEEEEDVRPGAWNESDEDDENV